MAEIPPKCRKEPGNGGRYRAPTSKRPKGGDERRLLMPIGSKGHQTQVLHFFGARLFDNTHSAQIFISDLPGEVFAPSARERNAAMQASLKALVERAKSFATTDFRVELPAVDVPTLVIHSKTAIRFSVKSNGALILARVFGLIAMLASVSCFAGASMQNRSMPRKTLTGSPPTAKA